MTGRSHAGTTRAPAPRPPSDSHTASPVRSASAITVGRAASAIGRLALAVRPGSARGGHQPGGRGRRRPRRDDQQVPAAHVVGEQQEFVLVLLEAEPAHLHHVPGDRHLARDDRPLGGVHRDPGDPPAADRERPPGRASRRRDHANAATTRRRAGAVPNLREPATDARETWDAGLRTSSEGRRSQSWGEPCPGRAWAGPADSIAENGTGARCPCAECPRPLQRTLAAPGRAVCRGGPAERALPGAGARRGVA
ncbi:hypothetical protein SVIOM342S_08763 [Streptomyces violaceorubidus]